MRIGRNAMPAIEREAKPCQFTTKIKLKILKSVRKQSNNVISITKSSENNIKTDQDKRNKSTLNQRHRIYKPL